MNMNKFHILILVIFAGTCFLLTGCTALNAVDEELSEVGDTGPLPDSNPLNSAYIIEGRRISLQDGQSENTIMPNSAAKERTFVIGQPEIGDLDGDGDLDAILLLGQNTGGSGTFYYIAAALKQQGLYHGTNGVLLGDRIALQSISIKHGIVFVNYLNRHSHEPMNARPSLLKSIIIVLENERLRASNPIGQDEQVLQGEVIVGHEVRSIKPCSIKNYYWLAGGSPALAEIKGQFPQDMSHAIPYEPVFTILIGKFIRQQNIGFEKDYPGTFLATQLVGTKQNEKCDADSIVLAEPAPGTIVASPLIIRGQAPGTWFFEGDFQVYLKDIEGNIISRGFVSAKSDWMTKSPVPFEGVVEFPTQEHSNKLILELRKNNPSDRAELDDGIEFVVFLR